MSRLRESPDDFHGALTQAADRLGLSAAFVEKDYWVTQTLRSLHGGFPGAFVFKGGTSLSKGYGLIERFSEDVDILVLPTRGDSATARERLLKRITERIAGDLDAEHSRARPPGRGKMPHRADLLHFPPTIPAAPGDEHRGGVLLETGYAGGEWPAEMVTITPMLCKPLQLDPAEYEDTAPFEVKALQPVRTLIEKLSLLHHVALRHDAGAEAYEPRCGRHYYDIYRLLDHAPTRAALKDRSQFSLILAGTKEISTKHYGGWTDRPEAGYAASVAFAPPHGSPLRSWLQARYDDAATLMPAGAKWPSFGDVLKRIGEHDSLL